MRITLKILILERNHMTIHKFEHLGIPDEVTQDHTKKLNESSRNTRERLAGIALLCLENMQQSGLLSEEEFNTVAKQCERLEGLPLYNESDNEQDKTIASHAISTIEEYLKEQGV